MKENFARMVPHDAERVGAELVPTNPSWSRIDPDYNPFRDSFSAWAQRQASWLGIWILSHAFLKKCEDNVVSEASKTESKIDFKVQCVHRNIKKLENEAQISLEDLPHFIRLSMVAQSMPGLLRDVEYPPTLTVGSMASHLHHAFRAYLDPNEERVIEKIFFWICGKSIQTARHAGDDRFITANGVYDSERRFWREEMGVSDIDGFFDGDEELRKIC